MIINIKEQETIKAQPRDVLVCKNGIFMFIYSQGTGFPYKLLDLQKGEIVNSYGNLSNIAVGYEASVASGEILEIIPHHLVEIRRIVNV